MLQFDYWGKRSCGFGFCRVGFLSQGKKMEGQEFLDVNQVMRKAIVHENSDRDHRSYGRFKEGGAKEREKQNMNYVDNESVSGDGDEAEVCVAEWVDTLADKQISCSFLKPNVAKKLK
jgi:hypothetical protein